MIFLHYFSLSHNKYNDFKFVIYCCIILHTNLITCLDKCNQQNKQNAQFHKCPKKLCNQHIDCWTSYGAPQRCVCDPILCGSVCLPETAKCPLPEAIVNGQSIYNDTDVGDIVEYNCRPGLVVRGPRKRHCLAILEWSGHTPVCSNQTNTCFSPPFIPNTQFVQTSVDGSLIVIENPRDDYRTGENVQIRCATGYKDDNQQSTIASCVGSEWQYTELNCQKVSCGPLAKPANSILIYRNDHYYQSEAFVRCVEGYTVNCASEYLTTEDGLNCKYVCQANGQWSGQSAVCEAIVCPEPIVPTHSRLVHYSTKVNGTVQLECQEGYEMKGSPILTCQLNGKWNQPEPVCTQRDCGIPPKIDGGGVNYITTTYGSKANVYCDEETTLSTYTDEIVCGVVDKQTSWTPQPFPRCDRHCYLFTVEYGEVSLLYNSVDGHTNFIPITVDRVGSDRSSIQNHNNNKLPILNGIILPGGKVRHGSQLNITCHPGYALLRSKQSITVCHNGVWSVRNKCIPAPCRKRPPYFAGARARFYSLKHNSRVRYEPFPGYQMKVDPLDVLQSAKTTENQDPKGTLRCLYGEWVGIPVHWEPMICSALKFENLIQAEVQIDGTVYDVKHFDKPIKQGQMVRFQCPSTYYLIGPKYTLCEEGNWTPKPIVSCEKHKTLTNMQHWIHQLT